MLPFLGIQLIYVAIAVLKIERIHLSVDNVKELDGCYDYIVVGLGSAGSVVAMRLAEDRNHTVLGLEAGIAQSALSDIPPAISLVIGTDYDWNFLTVPQQKVGFSNTAHRVRQPRGKAIGGSSVINAMVYNRGNKKDYDNWAKTYGAIGWDYKNVLKYFIKAENNTDLEIVRNNSGYHGTDGPVGISSPTIQLPIFLDYIKAMNLLGIKTVDINGAQQLGAAICQNFIQDGLRSSTSNSYLEPNPFPENLFISINSFVTKIIFENLTAIGVEFVKNNRKYRAYAKNEIIVSAGSLQSPQILMLSGIGVKDHLNQMGIPVVADLPVGNHLKDHVGLDILSVVKDPNKVLTTFFPDLTITALYQLYAYKTGFLSLLPTAITYYNTKYNDDNSWPNTCIFVNAFQDLPFSITSNNSELNEYNLQFVNQSTLTTSASILRPISEGTVRLNSTDPFDPPLIDPNYFSNERDLENFVEIMRFVFFALEESLLSSLVTIPKLPYPACREWYCSDRPKHKCDPYMKCLIKYLAGSGVHPVGTCRMGSVNRSDVVVDERLRVKGIKHLRVVDCSIMPDIPNGNTNAPAIMIGEYGSHLIKADNC